MGGNARAKAGATSTSHLGGFCFCCLRDAQVWEGRHWLKPVLYPSHKRVLPSVEYRGGIMGVGHRPRYNYVSACLALVLNHETGAAPNGRGLLLLRPWVCPSPLLVELFTPGSPKVDLPPPYLLSGSFTCVVAPLSLCDVAI